MTGLRLGQDFWMLPSKLGPQCRTRSELGSLHPDLSLNSPPSSPQPHYHRGQPKETPSLPVSLTWGSAITAHDSIFAVAGERMRETDRHWGQPTQSLQEPETPSHCTQVPAGSDRYSHSLPVPGSLCRGGWVSRYEKFCSAALSSVSNFHVNIGQ